MIGDNCFFNYAASINCFERITIGDGCLFGEGVKIYDQNHVFNLEGVPLSRSGFKTAPVAIGNNCWVCSNVVILKGVTIGDGCVIAAGAVVKSNVPANHMLAADGALTPIVRKAAA